MSKGSNTTMSSDSSTTRAAQVSGGTQNDISKMFMNKQQVASAIDSGLNELKSGAINYLEIDTRRSYDDMIDTFRSGSAVTGTLSKEHAENKFRKYGFKFSTPAYTVGYNKKLGRLEMSEHNFLKGGYKVIERNESLIRDMLESFNKNGGILSVRKSKWH